MDYKVKRNKKRENPNSYFLTPNSSHRGQLMVELMVSMSLLTIGLLGIFAVLSQSLALNRVAANQYIGANLAAEGVEVTKNILDVNFINGVAWNLGFSNGDYGVQFDSTSLDSSKANTLLRLDSSTGRYSYSGGTQTQFTRRISITQISTGAFGPGVIDEIKVVSTVTWIDRGGIDFTIDVEDRFRDWRTAP